MKRLWAFIVVGLVGAATCAAGAVTPSYANIGAPVTVAAAAAGGNVANGKKLFSANCSACHGAKGTEGGVGPSLKGEKKKKNFAATVAWIKNPAPPMPKLYPSPLSAANVNDVAAYVQTL